jgi:pyrroline-5-carboxylate reductase
MNTVGGRAWAPRRRAKQARKIAILGGGNLGQALARGWTAAGVVEPGDLQVVRRRPERLADLRDLGIRTGADNQAPPRMPTCS